MFLVFSENLKTEEIITVILPSSFLSHCRIFDGVEAHMFAKTRDPTKRHEAKQSSPKPSKLWVWCHERGQKMAHLGPQTHKISSCRPYAVSRNTRLLSTEMALNPVNCGLGVMNADKKWPIWIPEPTKYRVSGPARFQNIFDFRSPRWPQTHKKPSLKQIFGQGNQKWLPGELQTRKKSTCGPRSVDFQHFALCRMLKTRGKQNGLKRTEFVTNPRDRDALCRQNTGRKRFGSQSR